MLVSNYFYSRGEILKKYEVFLDTSSAPDAERLARAAPAARTAHGLQLRPPPPLPSHEAPTTSFAAERQLLRSRLMVEMQRVAKVLAKESAPRGAEELLRAAAWGELRSLRHVELDMESKEELCGWTAWHSAAAHGQEKAPPLALMSLN